MRTSIPKIGLENLSERELLEFNGLNAEPYGEVLAIKICEKLMGNPGENNGLYFSHRDYCGLGIFFNQEQFTLSTVYDGNGIDSIIAIFDSKTEFIKWLAGENDQSMSLFGERFNNQTITKLRLEWFLEKNYSPIWNDYCRYVREKSE